MHESGGVGQGHHLAAKMIHFFHGIGGDVAGSRHADGLAVETVASPLQHILHEVNGAVAGCLGADLAATEFHTLTREYTDEAVFQAFVLTEQVTDFACADADITGRHIRVFADVATQFDHERLTEAHDFVVGFSFRIEIGATLAAAHG